MGLVNAFGNVGGYAGPQVAGILAKRYGNTDLSFIILGSGMLVCTVLAFLLPKTNVPAPIPPPSAGTLAGTRSA